jgi:hypothetical protein
MYFLADEPRPSSSYFLLKALHASQKRLPSNKLGDEQDSIISASFEESIASLALLAYQERHAGPKLKKVCLSTFSMQLASYLF